MNFIYVIYRLFSGFAYPFLYLLLIIRLRNGKEDKQRWKEKLGFYSQEKPKGKLIWFHVASVGELKSSLKLIKLFLKNRNVLITSGTLTSAEIFSKLNFPETNFKVVHVFAPLDTPLAVKRFLTYFKPDTSCFIESEIWPNLIYEASRISKVFSVNTRLSPKSIERWQRHKNVFNEVFKNFTAIIPQSKSLALELSKIIKGNIFFVGNLKYDTEFEPNLQKALDIKSHFQGKVAVFASTHEGEEEKLIKTFKALIANEVSVILIPRHPNRLPKITELLKQNNVGFKIRSKSEDPQKSLIYIADTIGETAEFYSIADVIFMGGSLVEIGGHNIIEPAKLEKCIVSGTHYFNFTEIMEGFILANAITIAEETEIENKILELLNNESLNKKQAKNAYELAIKQSLIAQNIERLIISYENS